VKNILIFFRLMFFAEHSAAVWLEINISVFVFANQWFRLREKYFNIF